MSTPDSRLSCAASGDFKGVVQASDFLDRYGRSMMSGDKFASDYLDLYGLTIRNKNTGAITFAVLKFPP